MGYYSASHGRQGAPPTGYLPIEEHGIVGDLRTVALVGTDGTVDWYCPSRFDAPSLFGALLDARKGGYFSLWCRSSARPKQLYLPDTNILLTRFQGAEAVGEVIDFMVPETSPTRRARDPLVRQGRARWGTRSTSSRVSARSLPHRSAAPCCAPPSASRRKTAG